MRTTFQHQWLGWLGCGVRYLPTASCSRLLPTCNEIKPGVVRQVTTARASLHTWLRSVSRLVCETHRRGKLHVLCERAKVPVVPEELK